VLCGVLGCQPQIGDSCATTADCTDGTDRICDATLPGGYCTVFNCEPDTCPEEAACVAFRSAPAAVAECGDTQQSARLQRTFCMKTCNEQSDCRPGYVCMDLNGASIEDNPWSAEVIEKYGALVCVLPYSGVLPEDERETDVCSAGPGVSGVSSDAGSSGGAVLGDGG
jgi:hypothetical protein